MISAEVHINFKRTGISAVKFGLLKNITESGFREAFLSYISLTKGSNFIVAFKPLLFFFSVFKFGVFTIIHRFVC